MVVIPLVVVMEEQVAAKMTFVGGNAQWGLKPNFHEIMMLGREKGCSQLGDKAIKPLIVSREKRRPSSMARAIELY